MGVDKSFMVEGGVGHTSEKERESPEWPGTHAQALASIPKKMQHKEGKENCALLSNR